MANLVGQQLGIYRLIRHLGSGGFADVYLGEHIHLKKQVAVKVLRTQLSKDEAENFYREAQTLARLENPHIIRVLDFGFDHETPFLVMEYAPNGTLRQLHPSKTTVPLPTILAYVKQIAEALYYAHTNHVIHRDVKPENMLLGRQQELLLSDFGIATVTQSTQASNPHSIAGTAVYMAPEQINGKPRPASDQYALAVIVYEWLVGVPPFQGSFIEISTQHLMTSPPHPRSRMPTIPVLVEKVVLTALSKEPESRFGNIAAFANAMENAYLATQHPAPTPMSRPSPARPAGQPIRMAGPEPTGWSPTSQQPASPSPVPPPIYSTEAFTTTTPEPIRRSPTPPPPSSNTPPVYSSEAFTKTPPSSYIPATTYSSASPVSPGQGQPASKQSKAQLSLFAVARAYLEPDDRAFVGKTYSIIAGISPHQLEEGYRAAPFSIPVPRRESISFDILLHASENIKLKRWRRHIKYRHNNQSPGLIRFTFQIQAPGRSSLVLDFYHERRWLRTIRLEFESEVQSQHAPALRGGI